MVHVLYYIFNLFIAAKLKIALEPRVLKQLLIPISLLKINPQKYL